MAAQRGVYTVCFSEQTVAAASGDVDLWELVPADDKPLEIVAASLGNKSEVGDAQDEMLSINIVRGNTTSSNGSATTPQLLDPSDVAASFTAEILGATIATAGTSVTLLADTFNVRGGWNVVFPEAMRPKVSQANTAMYVRLTSAVADDLTLSGTLWVREL